MKPLTPTKPHAIIMVGIPGSGKTFFAEHFAKTFSAPLVSFSRILSITEDKKHAAKMVELMLDELSKTEKTFIYEGPAHTSKLRDNFIKRVSKKGYTPLIVWVQTESLEAKRRAINKSRESHRLSSDQFDDIVNAFEPPKRAVVISGKHTYASQLKIVLKSLAGAADDRKTEPMRNAATTRSSRQIRLR